MYARELMIWLHGRLSRLDKFEITQQRFERLRGYGLLPKGRENAGVRLSNEQIASAVLGFAHPLPGFAGHASLILGNLRPVGGIDASFQKTENLRELIASLINSMQISSDLIRLTLSVEQDFTSDEYAASIRFRQNGTPKTASFVSKYAHSLLSSGADENYDHDTLRTLTAIERSFSSDFFQKLSRVTSLSRQLDKPFKTDWTEYSNEEEQSEFHRKLGAKKSSDFLNLRVDAQVTWPKEPTRIAFGGHYFVLFPKAGDFSHSISIDLQNENISGENARSLMNQLLSIMSWCDDQPSSLHEGWSGAPVPSAVFKQNLAFMTTHHWYFDRNPPNDEQLARTLAFYRDGLNALSVGLASHAVLSFYRVIETEFGNDKWAAIRWINSTIKKVSPPVISFEAYCDDRNSTGLCDGQYIYKRCRVATAHAARDSPSNPDGAGENRRLLNAADVLRGLARHFIRGTFSFSDSYLTD